MSQKRIILSDSSLNRYGYRVLTSGLNIEAFKKNPVMLYMHFRDEGSPIWGNCKAIGHWEDIQINGDELSAIPVFDKVDDLSKEVAAKYEAGTFSAASIGIRIIATSANKDLLLPGQTRETITESELMEASIVDIPANSNAVRLYDRTSSAILAAGKDTLSVPELPKSNLNVMNLKSSWKAVCAFLKIAGDKADTTELSLEHIESLDAEMKRLKDENESLVQAKKDIEEKLTASAGEVSQLKTDIGTKDTEIGTLKSSVESKDNEIAQLKEQVKNLKSNPADEGRGLKPKTEPEGDDEKEDLAAFCEKNGNDYDTMAERIKKEGLI
ncbi:hypothetical protein [Bacteroides sp. UBA939]|uniref:hypothetical protein n=1 Tax=Bacteroides sp. UBA939 TaxID=1946092 RepID=UPI0025BDA136|nr:hypothetical protein [Bacteroides sp. UBA939]